MRIDLDRHHGPEDLLAFVEKVAKLRADGLKPFEIAQRLGIPRTTLNERLRRFRESRGKL